MRKRIPALRLTTLLLVIFTLSICGLSARAQVRIPREAFFGVAELEQVIRVGDQLEQERRWGEALTHYEQALRKHPGREELAQRLMLARLHYDVTRRYSDTSFVGAVIQLSERESLDLYTEVLLKIHAHYVDDPDWDELVSRGIDAVEVALSEASFLERHALAVSAEEASVFLGDVRGQVLQGVDSRHEARDAVYHVARLVQQRLQVQPQATILECACGAANSLDEYSTFLTGNQLDEVLSQIEGNFVGLGIELKAEDQALLIVNVIPGGPAARAGLQPGERIVEVDGLSTADVSTDVAADMLKGTEGSAVSLVVVGPQSSHRVLQLTRSRVEVPSLDRISLLDSSYGIGYLRLTSFQKTTSRDVEAALWSLHRQGMKSVILDVRGNPGGLLTAAVEVADKFVSEGSIVSTRGRSRRENYEYRAHLVGTWRVPLIVLIDGDSASASEIFASAIRDHRRGTIVGTRSYGKGSVQGIFPLNAANVGIRLTTAKFYSPEQHPISRRGVQPDVMVHSVAKPDTEAAPVEAESDSILEAALQLARKQLGSR